MEKTVSSEYAGGVGADKTHKEVVDSYDEKHGDYESCAGDNRIGPGQLKPSHDTKMPFGNLSGGKK